MNEVPCGYDWPRSHAQRIDRLSEAVTVIRLLWTKEFVTFAGEHFRLHKANLYDKPPSPVPVHLSGFGPRAAALAGEIADTFMTVGPVEASRVKDVLFPAVERGARSCGRTIQDLEKSLVLGLAFDSDREKAIDSLLPWRGSLLPIFADSEVHDPRKIEENGNRVGRDSLARYFVVATSSEDVISAVERHIKLGFDHIALAFSGDLPAFLKAAKKEVLPYFRGEYGDRRLKRAGYRGNYHYDNLVQVMEAKGLVHKVETA